jgi:undecaprenyl-diphosphatase
MSLLNVLVLAVVQGLAELLPVSSSAHVVVAEKLLGLDPSAPQMTLLLVMLHTGTMIAVIVYFWQQWRHTYFESLPAFKEIAGRLVLATALTAVIGEGLRRLIEGTAFRGVPVNELEDLFGHLEIIAPALAAAGVLILVAGLYENRRRPRETDPGATAEAPGLGSGMSLGQAATIGVVQGFCIPFRGFSRSGATISTGMLLGVPRARAEAFSFALVVILTPAADARELLRMLRAAHGAGAIGLLATAGWYSLLGAAVAFVAGLVALRWLSGWLEHGRWYLFGIYCLVAAAGVAGLHAAGY